LERHLASARVLVFFLGVATFIRVLENGIEDYIYAF
jgi:hypothetical protein